MGDNYPKDQRLTKKRSVLLLQEQIVLGGMLAKEAYVTLKDEHRIRHSSRLDYNTYLSVQTMAKMFYYFHFISIMYKYFSANRRFN